MTTHQQNAQTLIEKIQSLPIDRIKEVEDFVDFLKARTEHKKRLLLINKQQIFWLSV